MPGIAIDPKKVATNIVIFDAQGTGKSAAKISDEIGRHGVLCSATDEFDVRMVTHCDVDRAGIDALVDEVHGRARRGDCTAIERAQQR